MKKLIVRIQKLSFNFLSEQNRAALKALKMEQTVAVAVLASESFVGKCLLEEILYWLYYPVCTDCIARISLCCDVVV